MTAYSRPIVIREGTPPRSLEQLRLQETGEGTLSEKALQRALFQHPQALPIRDIDASYKQLIPLCMELATNSGRIDNLYATSEGRLVLVETKLWRNPQARREVVAQILDYAAQLTQWSFEDLDTRVSLARGEDPGFVVRAVGEVVPDLDEASYVGAMSASLRRGEFLLIIAGDGIRHEAESLVTLLERTGHFRFKMALVEMACFRLSADETLLAPRVLARTEIIERQIMLFNGEAVEVAEAVGDEQQPQSPDLEVQRSRYTGFWSAFLSQVESLDPSYRGMRPAKATNQYFPMPPGITSCWVSSYISKSHGRAGAFFTTSKNFPQAEALFDLLSEQLSALAKDVGCELAIEDAPGAGDSQRKWLICAPLSFEDSMLDQPDVDWLKTLAQRTVRLINAVTPRLNSILKS